jgi:hypothetical protein
MTFLSRLMDAEWLTSVQDLITSTSSNKDKYTLEIRQGKDSIARVCHRLCLQKAD